MSRIKDDIELAFEQASKEVEGWPEWVRSADVRAEYKKLKAQREGLKSGRSASQFSTGRKRSSASGSD